MASSPIQTLVETISRLFRYQSILKLQQPYHVMPERYLIIFKKTSMLPHPIWPVIPDTKQIRRQTSTLNHLKLTGTLARLVNEKEQNKGSVNFFVCKSGSFS